MTGNQLSLLGQIDDPLVFIGKLGTSFAVSGMFGCKTEAQGHVLAMHCVMEGQSPLTIMQTYHFIEGKLSMRADAMLGRFITDGGSYEVIQRTPECAEILAKSREARSTKEESKGVTFKLTWEEAQKEPFVRTKAGTIKDNWNTPRVRMQMLWARVASDMVRTLAPHVVCGAYTPEELEDDPALPAGVIEGELASDSTRLLKTFLSSLCILNREIRLMGDQEIPKKVANLCDRIREIALRFDLAECSDETCGDLHRVLDAISRLGTVSERRSAIAELDKSEDSLKKSLQLIQAPAAQSTEPAKRTRKSPAKDPAESVAPTQAAPVQTTADPVVEAKVTPVASDSSASQSIAKVVESAVTDPAPAAATPAATTAPASTSAAQLPQEVIDIVQLRDYVGPRWPASSKHGPWSELWPSVKKSMNMSLSVSDEEALVRMHSAGRTRLLQWLNAQRIVVDKLSTSKDLNAFANQNPTTSATQS